MSGNESKVAVKDVSFAIDKGECFSLLGVNGAGKSTIFKILTGDINPTDGQATIGGFLIPQQMQRARMLIGYCPQNNAILDNLTAREHLHLFSSIKGIGLETRNKLVE